MANGNPLLRRNDRAKRAIAARIELEEHKEMYSPAEIKVLECMTLNLMNEEIAEKLGLAKSTIAGCINRINKKQAGKKAPLYSERLAARKEVIREFHRKGNTVKEIMELTKETERNIFRYLKDMGLTPNPPQPPKQDKYVPKGISEDEASRVCAFTERNVIRRRLARGWDIERMAAEDNCSRDWILQQFHKYGVEIPEGEAWVYDPKSKTRSRWYPRKTFTRKLQTTPKYDQSNVRTYREL